MDELPKPSYVNIKLFIFLLIVAFFGITAINAFAGGQKLAADQVRVSDIALIQQFLKAYDDNQGQFPTANSMNQPLGWEKYLEALPNPPAPASNCSTANNQYKYVLLNEGGNYRLSFCLGHDVGNFKAGINLVGPE